MNVISLLMRNVISLTVGNFDKTPNGERIILILPGQLFLFRHLSTNNLPSQSLKQPEDARSCIWNHCPIAFKAWGYRLFKSNSTKYKTKIKINDQITTISGGQDYLIDQLNIPISKWLKDYIHPIDSSIWPLPII